MAPVRHISITTLTISVKASFFKIFSVIMKKKMKIKCVTNKLQLAWQTESIFVFQDICTFL